jgi:hypothetical protein
MVEAKMVEAVVEARGGEDVKIASFRDSAKVIPGLQE